MEGVSLDIKDAKYDPFRRADVPVFGSLYEAVKTILMIPLMPFRALFLVLLLALYSGMCALATWGLPSSGHGTSMLQRSKWRMTVLWPGYYMCRLALLVTLGMWVNVTPDSDWKVTNAKGEKAQVPIMEKEKRQKVVFFVHFFFLFQIWVSNHVSYVDVLVYLATVAPVLGFVAKKSIWSIPFIGVCVCVGFFGFCNCFFSTNQRYLCMDLGMCPC